MSDAKFIELIEAWRHASQEAQNQLGTAEYFVATPIKDFKRFRLWLRLGKPIASLIYQLQKMVNCHDPDLECPACGDAPMVSIRLVTKLGDQIFEGKSVLQCLNCNHTAFEE